MDVDALAVSTSRTKTVTPEIFAVVLRRAVEKQRRRLRLCRRDLRIPPRVIQEGNTAALDATDVADALFVLDVLVDVRVCPPRSRRNSTTTSGIIGRGVRELESTLFLSGHSR